MKTSWIRIRSGFFVNACFFTPKPDERQAAPPLDVQLYAGEVHDIVKSVCRISRENLASGQTQQNFSFIQAAKGKRSGEVRRKGSVEEAVPWEAEGISRRAWYYRQAGEHTGQHGGARRFSSETRTKAGCCIRA